MTCTKIQRHEECSAFPSAFSDVLGAVNKPFLCVWVQLLLVPYVEPVLHDVQLAGYFFLLPHRELARSHGSYTVDYQQVKNCMDSPVSRSAAG